ncbi:hypothetical protein [Mycobacterium sp. 1274761.0]|nr:hypothetical protein [Mycobacterium sp. 1274761.0]
MELPEAVGEYTEAHISHEFEIANRFPVPGSFVDELTPQLMKVFMKAGG